jgi:hypothetical protein
MQRERGEAERQRVIDQQTRTAAIEQVTNSANSRCGFASSRVGKAQVTATTAATVKQRRTAMAVAQGKPMPCRFMNIVG